MMISIYPRNHPEYFEEGGPVKARVSIEACTTGMRMLESRIRVSVLDLLILLPLLHFLFYFFGIISQVA